MATDTVAQIKERLSIQDVIAPYVKLHRAGKSLTGLCPFHKEKTPSFHVSLERGTWHCFGCGEGGDAISFVEKIEGVDFKGALTMLGEKAGVKVEFRKGGGGEESSKKDRLRAVMSRASDWYAGNLKGAEAFAYAQKRGLTLETIKNWGLGYAPDTWRALLEALTAEGFTTEELLSAGLIKEADGKLGTYYDRFRNRLMFPIRDAMGQVVAFTGRALAQDEQAKYLNSPETELYHKSHVLFGMDRAKDAIRTRGFSILVEGQLDLLLAHQEGFTNTVALSGTALTEKHLALLKRYSENLMIVLDADSAGMKATVRSAHLALKEGLRVKAARLPRGKDPADLLSEDPKEFSKRIAEAKPIVDFFVAELSDLEKDPHRLLRLIESIVLPLIVAIKSPMERDHFVQSVARALGLSPEAIRESLKSSKAEAPEPQEKGQKSAPQASSVRTPREHRLEQLQAIVEVYAESPLAKRVKQRYSEVTEADLMPSSGVPESTRFEVERLFGESPNAEAADELLHAFETAVIREAYQEAVAVLRKAEAAGDPNTIRQAQEVCAKLSTRLASF